MSKSVRICAICRLSEDAGIRVRRDRSASVGVLCVGWIGRGGRGGGWGALVSVGDTGSDTERVRLGRVVSLRQALDPVGALARVRRHGVRVWPAVTELVGVRLPDSAFFEDAFLMPGAAGDADGASLFVPAGRWRAGPAMMRTPGRDLRIVFGASLERDPGFERVSVRIFDPLR